MLKSMISKYAFHLSTIMCLLLLVGCTQAGNTTINTPNVSPTSSATATPTVSPTASPPSSVISSNKPVSMGKVTALRLADFQTGWAGGEGWIARTDNGGKSWSTQYENKYIVNQLFALNSREVWATWSTGKSGNLKLVHTEDGGKHWTDAGEVPNQGFLHFVSSKNGFSGNSYTKDGGKTWSSFPVPSKTVGEAYFHDIRNGWAVTQGKDKFEIMRTTDGGQTWRSVMSRSSTVSVTGAIIRSVGQNDAWVELIGDSGMSQTSYSLFHTEDGGQSWIPVLANNQAGSGPAPGYKAGQETKVPHNTGSGPGTLYVVNPKVAFMGGQCMACDLPNTMGKTTDGGKTWINLPAEFPGYGIQQLAAADAQHIWWINTDSSEPSVMYISSDGGTHWTKVHTFTKPN